MKWIAFIFLIIFTAVQAAPAVKNKCKAVQVSIFNPDEEKGTENVKLNNIEEIKEKKICYHSYVIVRDAIEGCTTVGFHVNKDKLPLPVKDIITPPPNYA